MRNQELALFGGAPVITRPMQPLNSLGDEEALAASEVVREGVLSAYIGAKGPGFMGGPRVKAFEEQAAQYFKVKHALAVNSWTSGLIAAIGAIGLEPGDEVITTPWTMAATATAILHWNGIPIFADINPITFNICPKSVESLITPRTKAILTVDIFGLSSDIQSLRAIANKYGLKLLGDTAQAPGARVGEHLTGTLVDIGGFSLNYHKHIHCGEGGIVITNDDRLAERVSFIRNHGEAVIQSHRAEDLSNILGFNFRMGEIEAAIASIQLRKLDHRVSSRQRVARELNNGLSMLRGLRLPYIPGGMTHVYYVYGLILEEHSIAVPRERIVDALKAEGVPGLMSGYQNLHRLPLFQEKIAYGKKGFPWNSPYCETRVDYSKGICPQAERLHDHFFIGLNICMNELPSSDVQLIIEAFQKVWRNLDSLQA